MVCCLETMDDCDKVGYGEGWQSVNLVPGLYNSSVEVVLDTSMACEGGQFSGLAYLWLETPCAGEEMCPLYSDDEYSLPVAPFKIVASRG